jgi:hypothetical protein
LADDGMKLHILIAAVVAGTIASGASAFELTIHPGVGIGKVKLGMTKAQVERVLGRDRISSERDGAYTEFAWNYETFTVGFVRGRAVQIATSLANQRTKKGVGVGATWLQLMRTHPGGQCAWNSIPNRPPWPEYLLGRRGGRTQTLWVFKPWFTGEPLTVRLVVVRTTFRPLPQFHPKPGMLRCAGNWRRESGPQTSTG